MAASHGCKEDGHCAPARQFYRGGRIDGAVDFIFGDALAWFEGVELHFDVPPCFLVHFE